MRRFTFLIICLLSFATRGLTVNAQEARAGQLVVEPYLFRTFDGKELPAELGKVWVRENRNGNSNRLIQLTFVRLKSTSASPGAPIIFLAGGPGAPGVGMGRVPVYFRLFDRLREVSDIVLLDQRGLGMSSPSLQCPATPVPTNVFESSDRWLRTLTDKSRSCAAYWRAKGVEVAAYTNDASADDLDDLRQALGAERISLIGHSYGTVLAQAAVRRHGARLDRVVFASTEGQDHLINLPSVWDTLIKKLSYFAVEDARVNKLVPDLDALYRRVLFRLEQNPVTLTVNDAQNKRPVQIRVGKIGLQWLVRHSMSDARNYAWLPALLYTIERGDFSLLTRHIEPLYNDFQGRSPMANAVDCSVGWSAERLARAHRETPEALFSNVNLQWTTEICKAVSVPEGGTALQPRLWSTLPALFISGTLDTNTPPFQAEEVRWGFPNSSHLIVENGGHETLPSSEVQSVVVDFFKGQNVKGRTVSFERPRFLSVEEAKTQPAGRR
ncbi:MAG TPA: alpha/beta fold hydrolase [Pyrinomonadaceae bacterium]|nr:alpha/beta fold hydrolase [Pyrinomonadaceae bacterium]